MENNTLAISLKIEIGLLKEALSKAVAEFESRTGFEVGDAHISHQGNEADKFGNHYIDVDLNY